MQTDRSPSTESHTDLKGFNWLDGIIILGFVLFSLVYFLGRWQGATPFVYLGGDAGNIATFVAGREHPDLFVGDEVLADLDNFRAYWTIHIPLVRLLAKLTGDYGTAFISLLGPHVAVQAIGFYLLGRAILRNRYWAALLAIACLMPVTLNLGEFWGIHRDPLPRFTFQALLPYLLMAAIAWRSRPALWPMLMALIGALVYVHPVSAPAWGLAVWLGLWAAQPKSWNLARRLGIMLLMGLVFVAVAIPFALHYLRDFQFGQLTGQEQILAIMDMIYGSHFLDLPAGLRSFIWHVGRLGILPLSLVGAVAVYRFSRSDRALFWTVVLWAVGVVIVSALIPLLDHAVTRALGRLPLELDLIRGLRYTVPIMLMFCLWPLALVGQRLTAPFDQALLGAVAAILVGLWALWNPPVPALSAVKCWRNGQFLCPEVHEQDVLRSLEALRDRTPPGSRILATGGGLAVRYYALRPLVYLEKDSGILGYADHAALLAWYGKRTQMEQAMAEQDPLHKTVALVNLGRQFDAQYLLVDYAIDEEIIAALEALGARPIQIDQDFSLIQVE